MRVTIIGTGYVGLSTGVCLAHLGHEVTCLDIDEAKVERLRAGKVPFHEPHLPELLASVRSRIHFTTTYEDAIPEAEVIFITVGTPARQDGSPDLRYVESAAHGIGRHLGEGPTVVVNKSTVPIGSGNWVESLVSEAFQDRNGRAPEAAFSVASNPEFLREGSALHDMLYPDRVVIGADHDQAVESLHELYRPILEQSFSAPSYLPRPEGLGAVPIIQTDLASAELVKYAANGFLALKISFINEIAELAERVGADVTQIARGIGLDSRIGNRFLQAGVGWGGSCFGKDTAALVSTAAEYGLDMPIIKAARSVNEHQRERVVEKLQAELKILKGKRIGLLGLSFKPNTDDMRDAPALDIAQRLIERGARVLAHDPVSIPAAKEQHGDLDIRYCEEVLEVADGADALVLVTDWAEYRDLPWEKVATLMRTPVLLDGRNFLSRQDLADAGITVLGMGR